MGGEDSVARLAGKQGSCFAKNVEVLTLLRKKTKILKMGEGETVPEVPPAWSFRVLTCDVGYVRGGLCLTQSGDDLNLCFPGRFIPGWFHLSHFSRGFGGCPHTGTKGKADTSPFFAKLYTGRGDLSPGS